MTPPSSPASPRFPHPPGAPGSRDDAAPFRRLLAAALERRRSVVDAGSPRGGDESAVGGAFRVFSGEADGLDGVYVDVYGAGAVLIVYEGRPPRWFEAAAAGAAVLEELRKIGVRAVYLKPFAKDRSRMGGEPPACVTEAAPLAGEALPESILIREKSWLLEIRLYDGLSTGLFLDQRENRGFVAKWTAERLRQGGTAPAVLNTFAYTCAFSVAAAQAGGMTTSVDVSGRYLDWGKRSFAHNGLDAAAHRFAKMDTFEYFGYARRKGLAYDLIILDPPSFASGSKRKGIRAWSSTADYAKLVSEAAGLLRPKGVILASTNTQELCRDGRLEREIRKGLTVFPRWVELPPAPLDFARERERFAARAFTL